MKKQKTTFEFSNIKVSVEQIKVRNFIKKLISDGVSLHWSESTDRMVIMLRDNNRIIRLNFHKELNIFHLVGDYNISNNVISDFINDIIRENKGNVNIKYFAENKTLYKEIRQGELVTILEIDETETKVLFSKENIINPLIIFQSTKVEERISVLRLEMDYELACLYESMSNKKRYEITKHKKKIALLRKEMILLEVF